jgi:hypothetical protein
MLPFVSLSIEQTDIELSEDPALISAKLTIPGFDRTLLKSSARRHV